METGTLAVSLPPNAEHPMIRRIFPSLFCLFVLTAAAWLAREAPADKASDAWKEVVPGVLRSPGLPACYALLAGEKALLIDATHGPDGLRAQGVKTIDAVLLTHHHRDTAAFAGRYLDDGVPVRAPKASAEWLTPDGVQKYWKESIPLRGSRTAYLVLPEGLKGVDCSLTDGQTIDWNGWTIQAVAAPGHSHDHFAYAARKGKDGPLLLFCGDALASPGKLWSPYTTDWDHWTDLGLKPAHESLTKLDGLKPAVVLPAHGDVIADGAERALTQTAAAVREVAFLKSFERYTKERLKDAPRYAFLAREQAESNGSRPWTKVSEHLWLTGNTYVLVSRDNACLVVDPWDPHSAKQIPKLKADQKLGPIEVVLCSHAHFDHYDGVYVVLEREKPEVWTLDRVAAPLAEPFLLRQPFLDARPVKIDRRPRDGETLTWREYELRFHHLPGQTEYTMGVEMTIDGKRCFFTADNFFHQDQFSGTGGWMGLNRSWPMPYAASAQQVLDAKPDWVLAEHGGPFEFNAEDFKRRVQWGKDGARAADAVCVTGNHRHDWDPHRVHVEPLLQKAKPGETIKATLVVSNALARKAKTIVTLEGRGLTADQTWEIEVAPGGTERKDFTLQLDKDLRPGRNVFALREAGGADGFLVAEVGP
jgi:glyoxylase-like metal-dependent hydrolase (beta-lactamase superfamily II)